MDLPKFKIRCSAIGRIMGGDIGLSDSQKRKLVTLQEKIDSGKALTKLQEQEFDKLHYIKDNPEPTQGMKTYCEEWVKSKIYKREKQITSKYMDKGNFCESWSIEYINATLLENFEKNEEFFQNEYLTGTPDIVGKTAIIDIKNSWDFSSFPLFDSDLKNKDYFYQLQGYMSLTGKNHSSICYTLMDAPHHIIEREARSKAYREGGHWEDHFESEAQRLTYGDIGDEFKIKLFPIDFDASIIDKIHSRVIMCREYIENKLLAGL